ncbi:hypothetical protein B0H11DRAFT_1903830 [Mycena galericulata]|nr:hypothetical protein B0H11DRAFT_2341224 [Mycena galericulata]KAJ7506459.1 hypothetical protein B0H11DRAFT_1903830 [Mycena galericulata]
MKTEYAPLFAECEISDQSFGVKVFRRQIYAHGHVAYVYRPGILRRVRIVIAGGEKAKFTARCLKYLSSVRILRTYRMPSSRGGSTGDAELLTCLASERWACQHHVRFIFFLPLAMVSLADTALPIFRRGTDLFQGTGPWLHSATRGKSLDVDILKSALAKELPADSVNNSTNAIILHNQDSLNSFGKERPDDRFTAAWVLSLEKSDTELPINNLVRTFIMRVQLPLVLFGFLLHLSDPTAAASKVARGMERPGGSSVKLKEHLSSISSWHGLLADTSKAFQTTSTAVQKKGIGTGQGDERMQPHLQSVYLAGIMTISMVNLPGIPGQVELL